jgi:REP element-mobilizing transposase RayT
VKVHSYVLMENHFHLVATTPEGNLSKWMHQLKTAYTVYFNHRHQVVGHLFEGRFKSTVIEAEKARTIHLPILAPDCGYRATICPDDRQQPV